MSLSRFERELLASGKTSAPSAERRRAAKVAVLRAAGVAAAAATLTASSTAAGAGATATATSGVKALGLVKLVVLGVLAASAIGAVAVMTSRASTPAATVTAAPDVSVATAERALPSAAPTTPVAESPPAIASVPVSSLPDAPASASASARAARSPAPSASGAREPAAEDDPLATEARILEAARACLARGDRTCAQTKLDEHEARFARGPLADEAALLAIDVALAAGDRPKARRLARSLVARSPHGAWNARVKTLALEEDGPP